MKKKSIFKKIFIGLAVFLLLVVAALAAIPFLFKDKIIAGVKQAVNENLNAKVDFKDVDISLLRSFPNLSVRLEDYSVVGIEEFEGVKLIGGESFGVTVDFWSAYNFGEVPLEIKAIRLDKPEVNVIVLANGKANYDIAKPAADTSTPKTKFQIELQEYGIYDANLTYDDRQGGTYVKALNLTHTGEGDFTQDVYDLDTKTTIGELTAESGGVGYLHKARLDWTAGFNIDMPNSKYTLRENALTINDLQVKLDGWLAMPNEQDIDMDLTFSAPQSEFKSLLSLVPNAYIAGYENVKANGKFKLEGFVKGKYSAKPDTYPAFKIDLDVSDADVKYPDLPLGISGINTSVAVNSPGSDLDKMTVDVSRFNLKIGSNPLEGYFKLRTPMSDPDVDTKIKGVLNLAELSKAFPMEGVKSLDGIINSDVAVKTRMSTIDQGDYENVNMSGTATLQNLKYAADGMPAVNISSMAMDFTPQRVNVPDFSMKLGKSDLSGKGSVDNILAFFSPTATMKGNFTLRSNYFNADEWMTEESSEQSAASTGQSAAAGSEEVFDRFDFTLDAAIAKLDYDVYKIKNLVAKGNFTPSRLTFSQLGMVIGDSDMSASGYINNIWNYLFKEETLGGEIAMRSNYFNLNQFMTEEPAGAAAKTTTVPTATEPFLVPANMNLSVNAQIGKVDYTNMTLTNLKGKLGVKNEAVTFQDMSTQTLGGTMAISGGYDTKNHEKPRFDLGMEIQRMDFQKAFNTFNTFQAVAPIGKYIQGAFNTKLTMSSELGKDLMPDLNSLSMEGLLQTLNGVVSNFKPLEEVGNKLNVAAFKSLNIKDSKNWFTVKNGAVEVKEFDHKFEDIAMRVGGSHKLVGDMDYKIIAKIPRSKIGKNPLGAAANTGLDMLGKEAAKLGINLDAGEFINVQINIGGTMLAPKIGFKVLGSEGKSSLQDAATAKLEEEANKKLDEVKAQAQKKLDEQQAKLEAAAKKKADELAAKAKKEAEKKAGELGKKAGEKAEEVAKDKLGKDAAKAAEEAKKKLEELNPLKKKKKEG